MNEAALVIEEPNKDALKQIFTELEFRRLAEQVLGETISVGPSSPQMDLFAAPASDEPTPPSELKTIENTEHNYHFVDSNKMMLELAENLAKQPSFCFDTETTGLDPQSAELVGLAFAWKTGEAYYVPGSCRSGWRTSSS